MKRDCAPFLTSPPVVAPSWPRRNVCALDRNGRGACCIPYASLLSPVLNTSTSEIGAQLVANGSLFVSDQSLFNTLTPSRAAHFARALENRTRHITFVFDGVHDAHNLAAIARTCEACGVQDLHFVPQRNNNRKESVLRRFRKDASVQNVSKGCHKWLTLYEYHTPEDCIQKLRENDYAIWTSKLDSNAVSVHDFQPTGKVAFVFGNERDGVGKEFHNVATGGVCVPMTGFVESLNVSVAVGITAAVVAEKVRKGGGRLSQVEKKVLAGEWLRYKMERRT